MPVRRRGRSLTAVTAVLLLAGLAGLTGCAGGSSDSGDPSSSPSPGSSSGSEEPPPGALSARFDPSATALRVRYTWTNTTDETLRVVTAAGVDDDVDPTTAYLVGGQGGEDGEDDGRPTVEVALRLFERPDPDTEYESLPVAGVTEVAPGEEVSGRVEVPRPFATATPFDEPGPDAPDADPDAASAVLCLGVLLPPYPGLPLERDGTPVVNHGSTDGQAVICTGPATL